jgi:hypothetical protein
MPCGFLRGIGSKGNTQEANRLEKKSDAEPGRRCHHVVSAFKKWAAYLKSHLRRDCETRATPLKTGIRCGKDWFPVGVFSLQVKQHALRGGFRTRVSRWAGRGRAGRRQDFASGKAECRWKTRERNVSVHAVDLRGRPSATARHFPDTAGASSAAIAGSTSRTTPIANPKASRTREKTVDLFPARLPDSRDRPDWA